MSELLADLALYLRSCWLQYRALFNWANPPGYLSSKVMLPVFQLVFFVELGIFARGRGSILYVAVGNAFQLAAINGVFGVMMTVGNERRAGTLSLLLVASANRVATLAGRVLVHWLDGILGVGIGFAAALLLFPLDLSGANVPLLVLAVAVVSLTTTGLGLFFGSLALVIRDIFTVANVLYVALLLFCGVNFPVGRLPSALQMVSAALPMTRGIQAGRLAAGGADLAAVAPALAGELLVGAAYAVLGYLVFKAMEVRVRAGGLADAL